MASAGDKVTIRPATGDDSADISRLLADLSRKFITPDYTDEGTVSLLSHQSPAAIRSAMTNGTTYLVAVRSGDLVAAGGILTKQRHLYHLFVDSRYHRQGIGRRLWDELRSLLDDEGPITVNSSRVAIGFYERLGFRSTGPAWEKEGVIAYPMVWSTPAPQRPST